MTVDTQINEALQQAEIAILKQDRLRALKAQEQQIRASWGKSIRPVSRKTKLKLLLLILKDQG